MENYTTKDASDYSVCANKLRRREAEDGLMCDRKSGLMCDYSLPKYNGDPLVEEYRQLAKLRQGSENNGGSDEDPMDSPETSRQPIRKMLSRWFGKRQSSEER